MMLVMQEGGVLAQYANVFIPLGVSLITAVATFFVYREKVGRLEQDSKELKAEIRDIRDKVISCETSLKEREPLTKRKSPISLTDRGTRVLVESGGQKFVDDNYDSLATEMDAKSPHTSYDVQEWAREIIESLKEDVRLNPIKEYLYKEGMEWNDVAVVLGIYLRDKVLKTKGWAAEDIDKHDPNGKK